MNNDYQRCTYCIMDTTDPYITFDEDGVCNHCKRQKNLQLNRGYHKGISEIELEKLVSKIKHSQRKKEYDVVIGVSGGVDSAYSLHIAVKLGLRVLAVHVDAGWNSEIAVSNIEKLCSKLDVDLHTIVVDWREMKELQRAFILSGIPNLDIPQDHVFVAAVYLFANKNRVRYIINGSNFATEGILPKSWGYDSMDYRFIQSIYSKFGRKKNIQKIPMLSLPLFVFLNFRIKKIKILNYVNYSKTTALSLLSELYDWQYYGGKHFESRSTKFFQSYYLPNRYFYDKRLAHLSSLIVNGELSREEAFSILNQKIYEHKEELSDLDYILKKTDLTRFDWQNMMDSSKVDESNYRNSKRLRAFLSNLRARIN